MDKDTLGSAIAGGAIAAALIEKLFDKGILTLDEGRAILDSAMRSIGPYIQRTESALVASQIIAGLQRGKFSARDRAP